MYLKEQKRKKKNREKEILSTGSLPNSPNCQVGARLKPGARTPPWTPAWVAGTYVPGQSSTASQDAEPEAERPSLKPASGPEMGCPCSGLTAAPHQDPVLEHHLLPSLASEQGAGREEQLPGFQRALPHGTQKNESVVNQ